MSSKQNRKPGWKQAEAEYTAWLAKMKAMTLGITGVRSTKTIGQTPIAVMRTPSSSHLILKGKYVIGSGTKVVHRPEILYRDDPEMLARELAARKRKFNAAPAYNKGGDQFVTEEALQALLFSNKRRS